MSVSIVVGITVITRTLSLDKYARNAWPNDNSAAFVAQYVPDQRQIHFRKRSGDVHDHPFALRDHSRCNRTRDTQHAEIIHCHLL